jgi:hypothetical protein
MLADRRMAQRYLIPYEEFWINSRVVFNVTETVDHPKPRLQLIHQ